MKMPINHLLISSSFRSSPKIHKYIFFSFFDSSLLPFKPSMDHLVLLEAKNIIYLFSSALEYWWEIRLSDVLALCTRLRAVVMIDYGGKMPELQDHLCALISFMRKVSLLMNLQTFFFSLETLIFVVWTCFYVAISLKHLLVLFHLLINNDVGWHVLNILHFDLKWS